MRENHAYSDDSTCEFLRKSAKTLLGTGIAKEEETGWQRERSHWISRDVTETKK